MFVLLCRFCQIYNEAQKSTMALRLGSDVLDNGRARVRAGEEFN